MRKIVLMTAAGMVLAFTAPLTVSAAPAMHLEAVRLAAQGLDNTTEVAWHCRRGSGWCRGSRRGYRPWRRSWRR